MLFLSLQGLSIEDPEDCGIMSEIAMRRGLSERPC